MDSTFDSIEMGDKVDLEVLKIGRFQFAGLFVNLVA